MKKMSKILSVILAISMVISMIPATFAAEGEADYAGVTVVYPFTTKFADEVYAGRLAKITELKYTSKQSFGRAEWHSTTSSVSDGMSFGAYAFSATFKDGEYFAYKIRVPEAGKYTIEQKYAYRVHSNKNGKVKNMYGNMYIFDAGTADFQKKLTSENRVMQIDFIDKDSETGELKGTTTDAATLKGNNAPVMTATWVAPKAGEYIVVWNGEGEKNSYDRYAVTLGDLTLNGNGTAKSLIYADLTGTKTELDAAIGEEINVVLNAVYMSDGSVAADTEKETITYSSSADSIATITTDNKIKAVSEGNATIYAKNGDYVLGQIDVSVKDTEESGVKIVYPMIEFVYTADVAGIKPGSIVYENKTSANRLAWHSYTTTVSGVTTPEWSNNSLSLTFNSDTEYAAYAIKVPKSGKYDVSVMCGTNGQGSSGEMYLLPADATNQEIVSAFSTKTPVITTNFNSSNTSNTNIGYTQYWAYWGGNTPSPAIPIATGKAVLDAGEYLVVWRGTGTKTALNGTRYLLLPATMILDGGDGLAIMDLAIAGHDKTLDKGENTTVTATGTLSNTGLQRNVGGAAKFTYTSSNPAVATVDANTGVVTAVSGGVAKITATCTNSSVIDGYNSISTLIAVDEPTTSVSFGADASVGGINITTNVSGYTQGEVGSVDLNTPVEVKAEPTAIVGGKTYVFRGWVRGKADGGRVISLDATYGFTAMTNTYLTAIYTEAADEEYYAWNGEFLGTEQPSAPEVVGYSFSEWKESLVNNIKRFVAWYVQKTETYGVTFNKATTQHKYDDPVTLSSDTDVYWYRDGKLVDYGKSYTFNVWDNTEVTTSVEGHELPMLALDAKAKAGSYMVEYDANGKNVIEVGILFNAEADGAPIVSSCKEKMSSQRNLAENPHGQFAAKAGSYTKARGYLIYEENGAYKVIYSE